MFGQDSGDATLEEFVGQSVVVDVDSMFVFLGVLKEVRQKTIILKQADVHDLRDSTTTREAYVREARLHGIQPNRSKVLVGLEQVVSISLLEDVIE